MWTTLDLPGSETKSKQAALSDRDGRFQHMLDVSANVGWPKAFCDDLYIHDRQFLTTYSGACVWILRESGTHLYPCICESAGEAQHCRNVIHYHSGESKVNYGDGSDVRYYHVTNSSISRISAKEAYGLIRVAS